MKSKGLIVKRYPHFDAPISIDAVLALVQSPALVAKHKFFPFLQYQIGWTRFAAKGDAGIPKGRPIRKAARRDSCIFSFYRGILNEPYEVALQALGLQSTVLAYRRIPKDLGRGNKCNIHFANDAFQCIRKVGDCHVYALDISSFFENLDHAKIKSIWMRMLACKRLPPDHFAVFKAITKYAYIEEREVYEELGFIGPKTMAAGKLSKGYLLPKHKIPIQLCKPHIFRDKLAEKTTTNKEVYGIPQGAPISDLLANFYLIDFDKQMLAWSKSFGGYYFRYSDDILLIVPGKADDHAKRIADVQLMLKESGGHLTIKPEKCAVHFFSGTVSTAKEKQNCECVYGGAKNGMEYLGFRYDGKSIYLRDSTQSGVNRRIVRAARTQARRHVANNPLMNLAQLRASFNVNHLMQQFGRVEEFNSLSGSYKSWTFWTYGKRSASVFSGINNRILKQIGGHKSFICRKALEEVEKAFAHK